jgi:hypothetical protein
MFQLNENNMKRLMREEYTKRLREFLAEEMEIEYGKGVDKKNLIQSANGLKVRHVPTGFEYTVEEYDEAAGQVILCAPDQPRSAAMPTPATASLIEADIDNDGIPDELDDDIKVMKSMLNSPAEKAQRKITTNKFDMLNNNKDQKFKNTNKDFIVVPIDEFLRDYSL